MLHFGNIYIHNTLSCREMASLPVEKHDGKIGDKSRYSVVWGREYRSGKQVKGVSIADGCDDHVYLDPNEALSLRDWLIQESPTLERLAKEQEG